jgi:hypothetical protein
MPSVWHLHFADLPVEHSLPLFYFHNRLVTVAFEASSTTFVVSKDFPISFLVSQKHTTQDLALYIDANLYRFFEAFRNAYSNS